jgi:hypothetical protein
MGEGKVELSCIDFPLLRLSRWFKVGLDCWEWAAGWMEDGGSEGSGRERGRKESLDSGFEDFGLLTFCNVYVYSAGYLFSY